MTAVGQPQVTSSEVKIIIFDESGAVIPGCEIVVKSDSETIASHTGMDGSVALKMRNGRYALETSKAGFVRTDIQFFAPMPDKLRIVLKVDHTPTDGPIFDEVPTTTSDVPSVIEGPELRALPFSSGGLVPISSAPPAVTKIRSWQCLYLWKCSPHNPSQR
jgi:hypothetical protein